MPAVNGVYVCEYIYNSTTAAGGLKIFQADEETMNYCVKEENN